MKHFLKEMLLYLLTNNKKFPDLYNIDLTGVIDLKLRDKGKTISENEVVKMITDYDFFDINRNKKGKG